jgi:hypothetical protein
VTAPTYLHIRGSLAENMVYTPRVGHESSRPGRRAEGDPAYSLVLLDREGHMLVSVAPQVTPRGCGHAHDPLRFGVRGVLPMNPEGATYELRRGEIRLHAATIGAPPPQVSAVKCRKSKGLLSLRWEGVEQEGMSYSVLAAMDTGRRITVARGLTASECAVDLARIPVAGKGKLMVVAHDGVRSSEVEVASIDVPARPPSVHILAPPANSRLPFGQPLSMLGCCLDMGGQPCSPETAVWLLDGERVATGSMVAAINALAPGSHRLTLQHGVDADTVDVSVTVEVEAPDIDYREWEALMATHTHMGHPLLERTKQG